MIEYKKFNDKTGYLIYQIERVDLLKKLRDSFINNLRIAPKYKRNINSVRLSMAKMSSAEINRAMINFLTFNKNLSELMVKSCPKLIQKLCGKKLFIQRRAHTTINVPGNKYAKQWAHYEMISGISPFSYILWAPLHDLDDEGGAYHIDLKTSLDVMKKEEIEGLVNGPRVLNMMGNKKPPKLKFGEAIIFNPFVLHGNIPFYSKFARIACNVRFQSSQKPLLQKNTDYLKYFKFN